MKAGGAKWLRLGVVAGNTRAERFWEKCGYREVRTREGVRMGERLNTLRVMMKPLGRGSVGPFAAHEAHEQGAEEKRRCVGEDEQGHVGHAPEDRCERAREEGVQGKEANGRAGDCGVAMAGDALVPLAVPRKEAVVELLRAGLHVRVVVQEVGEGQDADDDEPGGDPPREGDGRLSPEAASPRLEATPHRGS